MKLLYGVQGTGNGHITRARVMAVALAEAGVEVDWVFSGRERERFFDMQAFGDFQVFKGLTFATRDGRIDLRRTMNDTSMRELWRDIRSLDLSQYDLVVTDFEPVVAWAARSQGMPCVGVGHQYAFGYDIPKAGHSVVSEAIMRWFAPVTVGLGVHWHHFGAPILPPIIETVDAPVPGDLDKALVYLPFENSEATLALLNEVDTKATFVMHCADVEPGQYGRVTVRGFSRDGFQASLAECGSVICNAGFELASEALSMGKRILVKPLRGQMEQQSNAAALSELGLGLVMPKVTTSAIESFLRHGEPRWVNYPDVASAIVGWLQRYPHASIDELVNTLWAGVHFPSEQEQQVA
ncbi:MJ1255/VC2487 family glycosyltransferase [Saccharospirillum mangrovi]|uniref:MJ1255/VC2487 family glycosyltransferase n=1 Tax=Saccharospirillum mangrovi TaxID=2161747 RepID=UPI000D3BA7C3|nr:MJ1255/VC2487 family glycosyltransferase [Saccharospirillum mangrovi]